MVAGIKFQQKLKPMTSNRKRQKSILHPRETKSAAETNESAPKKPSRQWIGELVEAQRIVPMRLFRTIEEAAMWQRAAECKRIRLVRVGSALWTRALDQELRIAQKAECDGIPYDGSSSWPGVFRETSNDRPS